MDRWADGTGQIILVHTEANCKRDEKIGCCVHGPSDHHMKNWPTHWRQDRRMIERICPHGICHPDPDDVTFQDANPQYVQSIGGSVHGCDGCCKKPDTRFDVV